MPANEPPLNILFLMTDQQRYDCTGYAPASKIPTPNIDRIAEGTAFSCCQTVNPICQPARTALLTGRYSHQIGTLQMSGDLDFSIPTYPQALQRAGYWTAGVGKFHYLQTWPWDTPRGQGVPLARLHEQFRSLGYDHLWESAGKQLALRNTCDYCNDLKGHGLLEDFRDWVATRGGNNELITEQLDKDGDPWPFGEEHHIDIVTGREILRAIDERPADRPFFIFGSFCSPHKPFDPPQRFLDQVPYEEIDDFIPGEDGELTPAQKKTLWKLRRSYKATLLLVDEQIGKILDRLESEGLLENTLILFTSDHGEMMGDHFRVQKSSYYRESLNVPLAIRHPRHLQGTRNDSPVELTDITATILDAAGLDPSAALARDWPAFGNILPGRSLLPITEGQVEAARETAFAECKNQWQCLVSEHYKYVRLLDYDDPDAPAELLFDRAADPNELENLIGSPEHAEQAAWHRRRLQHILDKTPPMQHAWAPLDS